MEITCFTVSKLPFLSNSTAQWSRQCQCCYCHCQGHGLQVDLKTEVFTNDYLVMKPLNGKVELHILLKLNLICFHTSPTPSLLMLCNKPLSTEWHRKVFILSKPCTVEMASAPWCVDAQRKRTVFEQEVEVFQAACTYFPDDWWCPSTENSALHEGWIGLPHNLAIGY